METKYFKAILDEMYDEMYDLNSGKRNRVNAFMREFEKLYNGRLK